jgi:hypothetical protein
MAVTAHWIQGIKVNRASGSPAEEFVLRADLVGFHYLPGRHTGKHIAHAFLFVLDRIGAAGDVCSENIYSANHVLIQLLKIAWVTLDNATNNDTFMIHLETLLRDRNIPFDKVQRRIRYVDSCFRERTALRLIFVQLFSPRYQSRMSSCHQGAHEHHMHQRSR